MEKYNERPQVARVKQVKGEKVRVEWFDGSWRGKWKVYKYKVGRKTVVWEEDVDKECVIHRRVVLTKDSYLDSQTKKELKIAYS